MQPQRHFGDDAERALRAGDQPGQVVAGRGLARARAAAMSRPSASTLRAPARLAHRAVADRVVSRKRASTSFRRSSRSRPGRSERTARCRADSVESLAVTPGSHDAIGILGVDGEDLAHPRQVEADPAVRRADVALERRARHRRRSSAPPSARIASLTIATTSSVVAGTAPRRAARRQMGSRCCRAARRARLPEL